MLRGVESQADAEYVSQLAHRLGVDATVEQREVKSYQAKHRLSLEEAAREVRYQFLAEVAKSVGAKRIAVGHTADDQAETVLMHLLRGSGTYGLQGMSPLTIWELRADTKLVIIRPLLEINRSEIEVYCQQNALAPREDSSNLSHAYLRNRIRHELLPLLQSYNPNINEVLLHTADSLAVDFSFLELQLSQIWDNVVTEEGGGLVLNTKEINRLHPALQRYLFRQVLRRLLGNLKDIEWKHIEKMRKALSLPAGRRVSLPKGLTLYVEYGKCFITANAATLLPPFPPLEGEYQLKVPGETALPGWRVIATILPAGKQEPAQDAPLPLSLIAYLDFEATGNQLTVRRRKPGDRFHPLGVGQLKKLQDFMVDAKISQAWRDYLPLVCSPQHILWVVGWRIDERVKVTSATKQLLRLQFIPLFELGLQQSPRFSSSS